MLIIKENLKLFSGQYGLTVFYDDKPQTAPQTVNIPRGADLQIEVNQHEKVMVDPHLSGAVVPVRCMDCEHWSRHSWHFTTQGCCGVHGGSKLLTTNEDDFCSWGKQRKGGTDGKD